MEKRKLEDIKKYDNRIAANTTFRGGKTGYDWEDSLAPESKLLGAGSYGTAILGKNNDVVKRGDIGLDEAAIIDRVGKLGLGPKLISVELDGPGNTGRENLALGRLAMSFVDGEPLGEYHPGNKINGVGQADAYWTARAQLHRAGIAHNDMHIKNVLIDKSGKARFIDMGLAQDNPKAALAEALGAFSPPRGGRPIRTPGVNGDGDWQVREYESTGGTLLQRAERTGYREELREKTPVLYRVLGNFTNGLYSRMRQDGYTNDEIATITQHGLRNDASTYEQGVWKKMNDQQAMEYINLLYEGV